MPSFVPVNTSTGTVLHWHAVVVGYETDPSIPFPGADLRLVAKPDRTVDLSIENGDLVLEPGLVTAVLASLWTDRRADQDDELPVGSDRRGYWGERRADRWGSRLWLLDRAKQIPATLRLAEDYCAEGLDWLRVEGIVDRVRVSAEWIDRGRMYLTLRFSRGANERWSTAWEATEREVVVDDSRYSFRLLFG